MLIDTLQQYGLTEKEAKVYIAGLGLGNAPGSTIARNAGENRVTVYSILKELVKKGIFSSIERQGVLYFSALSPDILAQRLEEKYVKFQNKVPELMALVNKGGNKPKVQFFEGLEGVKRAYEDTLSSEEDILAYVGSTIPDTEMMQYFEDLYLPKRIGKKIFAKVILASGQIDQFYKSEDKKKYRKSVYLSDNTLIKFDCEICIYGSNKIMIALYSKKDLSAIIIESQSLYNTMRVIFLHLWNSLEN